MRDTPGTELRSKEHRVLFDIIDRLRSHGIGEVIDLPEIIVCGDQSAGKSSVLEAISGHPFPTKDGVCTRFVTELALRREPTPKFKVSIHPGPERTPQDAERLRRFADSIANEPLNVVIESAKTAMGLSDSKRFSNDVLRVEISGPDQAHVTMVDLPGIFRAGSSEQSVKDVKTVNAMVRKAMSRPRSIILAVVSASNEFNNQEVTELARKFDPTRSRTLGLITKPDKLDEGSESERNYVRLARNQDVVLELGWHVLRNRGNEKNEDVDLTRDEVESKFFAKGAWLSVDSSHLGVSPLRKRLSVVLGKQILKHLPNLHQEVADRTRVCEDILTRLGDPRESPEAQRKYLLGVSRRFSSLMTAAIEGTYDNAFFGSAKTGEGCQKRIRAVVQNALCDFSQRMNDEGKLQRIVDDYNPPEPAPKGRELLGTFNPLIIRELFLEQCRPWRNIALQTMESIIDAATHTALAILRHVALAGTLGGITAIVTEAIAKRKVQLGKKVDELLAPRYEGHPITYNHYLTDMVRKGQNGRRARAMDSLISSAFSCSSYAQTLNSARASASYNCGGSIPVSEVMRLCSKFESFEPNMEEHGSGLVVDYAEAYYKVALKRFIDEVGDLAVERELIRHLPDLFTPEMVFDLTQEEAAILASEDEASIAERVRNTDLLAGLRASMEDLKRLDLARAEMESSELPGYQSTPSCS
ncbi:hypothetical protein MAPG_09701 [Magnaporthiopsis poae ATCC 64411]|uniref:Interferon-induced GTP-binding protein Mx n=1 Tax=Magnaporthiopsis poae (strain ATCC 64411 / 73-15) TaxID=644358 RepID=A0A0C4EAM6_MAGP6|nr:hypothetical protein MAPG_09701 [Magnaporthiopsis poae ATCC 64411]